MDTYEKKYKEALEKARQLCAYPTTKSFISDLQDLFPELKESEDEKVIKEIIELVMQPTWKTEEEFHRRNVLCAWLENVPVTIDNEKREGFHLGYKAGLERLEMKSAEESLGIDSDTYNKIVDECVFGEEDEAVLDALIRRLKGEDIYVSPHLAVECLESLKGRVLPKQEWSEEDEQHIDSLLKRLDALCRNKFERTRFAISEDRDWLKSLRPQNRWKPSDEQISLLQAIINEPNNAASESCQIVLKDILEQLKKLKKEQA